MKLYLNNQKKPQVKIVLKDQTQITKTQNNKPTIKTKSFLFIKKTFLYLKPTLNNKSKKKPYFVVQKREQKDLNFHY